MRLAAISALVGALLVAGCAERRSFPPASRPSVSKRAAAPSDWTIPKRFRGKLISKRVRYFPTKLIALTFDDGPSSGVTPRVLDALAAHNARATFFVVGGFAKGHPDLLRRIVSEGSAIGNHSYSHPKAVSSSQALKEINRTAEIVRRAVGRNPCCFRPPYGITNGNLARVAEKAGYPVITWTISTADSTHISAEVIARDVLYTPNPGDIVLMHDGAEHRLTADALPVILDRLTAMGYRCVTIPELLRAWDEWLSKPSGHAAHKS